MRILLCLAAAILVAATPAIATDLHLDVQRGPVLRPILTAEPEYKKAAELIRGTEFIVVGEVVDQHPRLSGDASQIFTEYTVEISRVLVGDSSRITPGQRLIVRVPGGHLHVDGVAVEFEALDFPTIPWLVPHLFFLERDADDAYRIHGGSQGVWELQANGRVRSHHPDVKHHPVPLHFNQRPLEFMLDEVNNTLKRGKR